MHCHNILELEQMLSLNIHVGLSSITRHDNRQGFHNITWCQEQKYSLSRQTKNMKKKGRLFIRQSQEIRKIRYHKN